MIRRGLQFALFCGFVSLGAAPSFGQVSVSQVEIANFHPAINGVYNTRVYADSNGTENFVVLLGPGEAWVYDNGTIVVRVEITGYEYPSTVTILPDGSVSYDSSVYSTVGNWTVSIDGVLWASVQGTGPDPYEENFPDWASAAVKIPLGFALGMALWASALATGIGLKWARDLASAAS